jgi:hypothetical protein
MLIWVPGVERRVNQEVRLHPVSITCTNFTHSLLTTCTVCSVIFCQRFYVNESSMWRYMLWSHYTKARISSPIVNFCHSVWMVYFCYQFWYQFVFFVVEISLFQLCQLWPSTLTAFS